MTLYTRVLSYLRPHLTALAAAGGATFAFAALDASAYVLLIPFVDALFRAGPTGGGGAASGEAGGPDLDALDDGARAEPTTAAHRDERMLLVRALEFADQIEQPVLFANLGIEFFELLDDLHPLSGGIGKGLFGSLPGRGRVGGLKQT